MCIYLSIHIYKQELYQPAINVRHSDYGCSLPAKLRFILTVKKTQINKKNHNSVPCPSTCAIILVSCSSSYHKSSIARLRQFPYHISPDSSMQLLDVSLQQFLVNTWLHARASSPTKWRQAGQSGCPSYKTTPPAGSNLTASPCPCSYTAHPINL